jgi:phosphate starvation-inducible PhoH-like protein
VELWACLLLIFHVQQQYEAVKFEIHFEFDSMALSYKTDGHFFCMALPRSIVQKKYIDLLSSRTPIVIASGPAGTGKTLLACQAASKAFINGQVDRIVLTRPAVSVDEQHGYLPGDLRKKMEPWTRPMFDSLYRYFTPKRVNDMVYDQQIEICPLAYMRGRTFDRSWILGDEMQNSTPSQMKMLLTRIGENSKVVVTGDITQHDRTFDVNGLVDLLERLTPSESIQHVQFTEDDVVRHEVIKEILRLYN